MTAGNWPAGFGKPRIERVRWNSAGAIEASIDGVEYSIPNHDPRNVHRMLIAEWEAAGNTIEPYVPPPPTEAEYAAAVTAHIEAVAQGRGYAHQDRLAGYVADPNAVWSADAKVFVAWRSAVWAYAYSELGKERQSPPTLDALIAALPAMEWPK